MFQANPFIEAPVCDASPQFEWNDRDSIYTAHRCVSVQTNLHCSSSCQIDKMGVSPYADPNILESQADDESASFESERTIQASSQSQR